MTRRLILCVLALSACPPTQSQAGSAIFIHPDGAGAQAWTAARMLHAGPDNTLAWDRLPEIATYSGHMKDGLVSTSHGGATTHAYGVKVVADSFGQDGGQRIRALSGFDGSIMQEAMKAGLRTGVVNSGHLCEPGTACFLSSADSRRNTESIAAQVVGSGADLILGGGERFLLPEGVDGRFGPGMRKDGRNLVEEARENGYQVVYSRDELLALDPAKCGRVLGVFAYSHTFHDLPEEILEAKGLPLYVPEAPTLAEMTRFAIAMLSADDKDYFLVVEEEGSDNFANMNNASGMMEALRRADEAFAVALDALESRPDTLLVTAADSDAGGIQLLCPPRSSKKAFDKEERLPGRTDNAAPIDGVDGTLSRPFVSAPDARGESFAFGFAWSAYADVAGGILARAAGHQADSLPLHADNTDIYRILYRALFNREADGQPDR